MNSRICDKTSKLNVIFQADNHTTPYMSKAIIPVNTASVDTIKDHIFEIRGQRVMLDRDLSKLYNVETRVPNQAVKRNIERFPDDFMFRLNKSEWTVLKSQIVTMNDDNSIADTEEVGTIDNGLKSQFVISNKTNRI